MWEARQGGTTVQGDGAGRKAAGEGRTRVRGAGRGGWDQAGTRAGDETTRLVLATALVEETEEVVLKRRTRRVSGESWRGRQTGGSAAWNRRRIAAEREAGDELASVVVVPGLEERPLGAGAVLR